MHENSRKLSGDRMGDVRFEEYYARVADAPDACRAIHALPDEGLVAALAGASVHAGDPYLANVLGTELMNRVRRRSAILDTAGRGVASVDAYARVTFLNAAAERLLGWSLADARGRDFRELVRPGDADAAPLDRGECPVGRVLAGECPEMDVEATFTRRDGPTFPVSVNATPLRAEGEIAGAVVLFNDVSARRCGRRVLEESEERYRSLFEHHPDGMFSVDARGILIAVNRAAERLLGYGPGGLIGLPFAPLLHPDDVDRAMEQFSRVLAGTPTVMDVRIVRRDGRERTVHATSVPAFVGGEVVGVHGTARDVTAEHRRLAALADRERTLRAIVEHAPDPILRFDAHERCTFLNAAAEAALGVRRADALGRTPRDAGVTAAEEWARGARDALRSGRSVTRLIRLAGTGTSARTFEARFQPEPDEEGAVPHVLAFARDVTPHLAPSWPS